MPTIVLKIETAELLAFLLIVGDEPLDTGDAKRDCILTGPPKNPRNLEHPISQARLNHPDSVPPLLKAALGQPR